MKNQLCPGGHFFITGCLNKAHTKINIFIHRHTAYLTKKEIKNLKFTEVNSDKIRTTKIQAYSIGKQTTKQQRHKLNTTT